MIEQIWTEHRDRAGNTQDRRIPSAGISCVLVALGRLERAHGSDIARLAGHDQANVTARWLPKLAAYGFVEADGQGQGIRVSSKPAQFWKLTTPGRQLADLLAFV